MSRIVPLWRSDEISVHRFDHPAEHDDRPYEETASAFMASFVVAGDFNLEIGEGRWRVNAGDVMLHHPGMRFRAGYEEGGFDDTCLTLTYLAAERDGFGATSDWARAGRPVLRDGNRVRFLRWTLERAVRQGEPMLAEFCASEVFREAGDAPAALYSDKSFRWYSERVHAARERLDRDFAETHTVGDLARSVGMSMFHFTRVFGEMIGRPPHRYLAERRLQSAKAMLEEGRSVTETCYAVGFNNLSHFSRSYRRAFGASPSGG